MTDKEFKSTVYTKTGDSGRSSLYNGDRRWKTNAAFNALGDIDEVNASLGIAREYCILEENDLEEILQEIQSRLMDICTTIATPKHNSSSEQLERAAFASEYVEQLEKTIDQLDSQLPPLKNFILPGGGLASTHLHATRTICRRAERSVWKLKQNEIVEESVLLYLNRVSDFFFVAARYCTQHIGGKDTIYKKQSK